MHGDMVWERAGNHLEADSQDEGDSTKNDGSQGNDDDGEGGDNAASTNKTKFTTRKARAQRRAAGLHRKRLRDSLQMELAAVPKVAGVQIEHPALAQPISMRMLLAKRCEAAAIEMTTDNLRALSKMCTHDMLEGVVCEPRRKPGARKRGGCEGSGFYLTPDYQRWFGKLRRGTQRCSPLNPPPSHIPTLHTHALDEHVTES